MFTLQSHHHPRGAAVLSMYCTIFQLGEGGALGWTVCPGQGASLQPLGTAQPYFLRADCALTRTSCPLYISSEQLVDSEY